MSFGSRHTEILLSLLLLTSWIREYACHVGNCSCTGDSTESLQFRCSNVDCTSDGKVCLLAFTDLLFHGNISNDGVIKQTEESFQFVSQMLDVTSGITSWNPDLQVTCTQANTLTSMAYDCISGPCTTLCNEPGVNEACVMTTDYPYASSQQHRECICQLSTTSNYVQVKMHDNNLTADQTLELISADNVVHQWNRTTAKGRAPSIGETLNISAEHTITLRWKNPTMQYESFFISFYANEGTISLNCSQPVSTTTSPAATKPTDIPMTSSGSISETSKTELPSSAQSSPASETHTSIDATITDAVTSASSATENSSDTSASVRTETETSTKGTDARPSFSTGIAMSAAPVQSNTKGFPIWIIFLILGILLVASIVGYIVYRKKRRAIKLIQIKNKRMRTMVTTET